MKISKAIKNTALVTLGTVMASPVLAIGAKVESLATTTVLTNANVTSASTVITLIGLGLIVWKAVESFFGEGWKGNVKPIIGGVLISLIGMQLIAIVTMLTGVTPI
jgi:hypothetical protein